MRRMVEFCVTLCTLRTCLTCLQIVSFDFLRLSDEKYLAEISWKCLSCTNLSSLERPLTNCQHQIVCTLYLLFNSVTDGNLDF